MKTNKTIGIILLVIISIGISSCTNYIEEDYAVLKAKEFLNENLIVNPPYDDYEAFNIEFEKESAVINDGIWEVQIKTTLTSKVAGSDDQVDINVGDVLYKYFTIMVNGKSGEVITTRDEFLRET